MSVVFRKRKGWMASVQALRWAIFGLRRGDTPGGDA
jgi:hypothetical protein